MLQSVSSDFDCISVAVSFLVILLSTLVLIYLQFKPKQFPKDFPGPPRLPFLGFLKYWIDHFDDWPAEAARLSDQYGRTWGGPLPNLNGLGGGAVFLTEPRNIQHVLKDSFHCYEKTDTFRLALQDLLGDGIFTADGSAWLAHRKAASHYFSRNMLREANKITNDNVDQICSILSKRIEESDDGNTHVDIQDIFFQMTIDGICSLVFGVELNGIRDGGHEFAKHFDTIQELLLHRYKDPFFALKRYYRLGRREKQIHASLKVVDKFAEDVIQSKRRTAQAGGKLGQDLLSRYLDSMNQDGDESSLSNKELRDIIMNIVLAGRDSTACALSWSLFELTRHPECIEKIVQEVSDVCGVGDHADFCFENIQNLTYLHAVAMEVLRLHPSLPLDSKYSIKDDVLPDGTCIQKGLVVSYLPYAQGRSKRIWGEDALLFRPERWLHSNGHGEKVQFKEVCPFKYITFNAGPRLCIGKPLALITMKLVLARLLTKFHFTDEKIHSGDFLWAIVLKMKGGFPLTVRKRQ